MPFKKGNAGGPGNPFTKRCNELRVIIYSEVSDEDMRAVVRAVLAKAKNGDSQAAKEIIDRLLGKAKETVELTGELESSGTVQDRKSVV